MQENQKSIASEDVIQQEENSILPQKENSLLQVNGNSQVSVINSPIYTKLDFESQIEMLRKLKLFPIFGDENIAKFSVNYFLYLEFFRIAIKVFLIMFIFSTILYGIYLIVNAYTNFYSFPGVFGSLYGCFAFAAGVSLRFLHNKEEKKLIEHYVVHDCQWTEKLFSVLIEGLPWDATVSEVKMYFNALLSEKGYKVVDALPIQDSHRYIETKNELVKLREKISKLEKQSSEDKKKKQEIEELSIKWEKMEVFLEKLEGEFIKGIHFKGKMIVIFNNIEAKAKIVQHFKIPFLMFPIVDVCIFCFDKYRFRNRLIRVHELPEPEDLIFSNLHYPKKKRIIRIILAYLGSFTVITTSLIGLAVLKGYELTEEVEESIEKLGSQVATYSFAFAVIVINFILERAYRYVNAYFVCRSGLEADINILNYGIFTSLLLYIVVQAILASTSREMWTEQLVRVLLMYFIKVLLIKFFTIFWTTKRVRQSKISQSNPLLSKVSQRFHAKYSEFDFIKGISRVVPLLLIPFTFLVLNPSIILLIVLISLYIIAIIDKYRMLKHCNPFKLKSASYMIKAFRVFRWDVPCMLWGSFLVIEAYFWNINNKSEIINSGVFWGSSFATIVVMILSACFSRSLNTTFKQVFFEKNSKVEYDSVCQNLSAHYRDKDPVRQIKRLVSFRSP